MIDSISLRKHANGFCFGDKTSEFEIFEPHDDYGIEFNNNYNIELSEPDIAIERLQKNRDGSVITELKSDLEIIKVLPIDYPDSLKYLDKK